MTDITVNFRCTKDELPAKGKRVIVVDPTPALNLQKVVQNLESDLLRLNRIDVYWCYIEDLAEQVSALGL